MEEKASKEKLKSSRRERFERVLPNRVNNICKNIRLLNNIAINKGNAYEYEPEEMEKAIDYIQKELNETKRLLNDGARFKF